MANIQHQFESLGFGYDNYTFMGYNNINGFYFTVYAVPGYKVYNISVYFILPDEEAERCFNHALKQFLQQKNKIIRSAKYENRKLTFYCKSGGIALEITDGVKEVTGACMDLFNQFKAEPVCSYCGCSGEKSLYVMEKDVVVLCPECFAMKKRQLTKRNRDAEDKEENVPRGIMGAALGGLAGAVVWVLTSLLGLIVWVAGMISCSFAFFGYLYFGRKMTRKGFIISFIVGFIMLFAGMYFAFTIDVFNTENGYLNQYSSGIGNNSISFFDAFALVPEYFMENIDIVVYNNIFGIIAYAVTCVACVAGYRASKRTKNRTEKLM